MTDVVTPLREAADMLIAAGGGSFELCHQCGLCETLCPWNLVKTFPVRRLIREAQFGLTEIEAENVWQCAACGKCPDRCPRGVRIIDVLTAVRTIASQHNLAPQGIRSARGSLVGEGNPWGGKRNKRADWASELPFIKEFTEGMEILYFPCCTQCYDARSMKTAVATANVLRTAGVDFGIADSKTVCCGESIRKAGEETLFKSLARENIKAFIDKGVRRIVVSSPHCYEAFKNEYDEFMVNFDVVHISEYLADLIAEGRLEVKKAFARRVTYHDPCFLGRHNGLYEQPRRILKSISGLELVEMADSHRDSLCCGGGAGRIWVDTPIGERLSDLRLQQARATGACVLATSCPYCILNLEDSKSRADSDAAIEIMDITEIVQEVI